MSVMDRLTAALADRYRIERELGAGGMATVYLAHDVKHDRKVALKVLKPELAAVLGAERFLAEIKLTANLQHPHILALFDSGEVGGVVYYVMPYVEGETLRDRLAREKQLPVDDALRIAREVGDALQHAHSHDVIHRDIKPENILLQGGHALVADFGIALAAARTGGSRMTETGMSLGTPTYMSPEQAMGERTLDARTDVYALGCVLYEMLTGDAPFTGSTAQAIVAKVLTERPAPIRARRERVAAEVEEAILTALEKLPADRFGSAAEFVSALQDEGVGTSAGRGARRLAHTHSALTGTRVAALAVGVGVLSGAAGWIVATRAKPADTPPSRLALVEKDIRPTFSSTVRMIELSADGQTLIFSGNRELGVSQLFRRRLDGAKATPIPGTLTAGNPRLTPDGKTLYHSGGGGSMARMSLAGGAAEMIDGLPPTAFLGFGDDGSFYWSDGLANGLHHGMPGKGDSLLVDRVTFGQLLPGGRLALGVAIGTVNNGGTPVLLDLRSKTKTQLLDITIVEARYAGGFLFCVRPDNVLIAVPLDLDARRVTGTPVELAEDVGVAGAGFAHFAVAANGTLAYIADVNNDLVRIARNGTVQVLNAERGRYHSPRIAPDGQRIAFDNSTAAGRDVYILSVSTKQATRATFQKDAHDPVWSGDGRGLYFLGGSNGRLDVFYAAPGTTTPPKAEGFPIAPEYTGVPLGDGSFLTTVPGRGTRGGDIARISGRRGTVDTLANSLADETYPVPSPDRRWFAFVSDQSGRSEVYVRSLTGGTVQLQISLDGGTEPVWSRSGGELFYRRPTAKGGELVAAKLAMGAEPTVTVRQSLFDVSEFDTSTPHANYDVSPDGSWFVFSRRAAANTIVVLQNAPELARRALRNTVPAP
jgi:serine/threonine-protein kinase